MEVKSDATTLQSQRRWTQKGIIMKFILDFQAVLVIRWNIFWNRHLYYTAPLYHWALGPTVWSWREKGKGETTFSFFSPYRMWYTSLCTYDLFLGTYNLASLEMTDPRKSRSFMSSCQQQACNMKMWRRKYHDLLLDDSYGVCCQQMTLRETIIFMSNSRHTYF